VHAFRSPKFFHELADICHSVRTDRKAQFLQSAGFSMKPPCLATREGQSQRGQVLDYVVLKRLQQLREKRLSHV
jgi:hypothetical protein